MLIEYCYTAFTFVCDFILYFVFLLYFNNSSTPCLPILHLISTHPAYCKLVDIALFVYSNDTNTIVMNLCSINVNLKNIFYYYTVTKRCHNFYQHYEKKFYKNALNQILGSHRHIGVKYLTYSILLIFSFKSKRYREKLRCELRALEELVPVERRLMRRRMDSQTVLRLVIAYLKTKLCLKGSCSSIVHYRHTANLLQIFPNLAHV